LAGAKKEAEGVMDADKVSSCTRALRTGEQEISRAWAVFSPEDISSG
jgi:hypothetical protein